jgi:hypothetical protein
MRTLRLALAAVAAFAALAIAACSPTISGTGDDTSTTPTPTPTPSGTHITSDTTWSGTYAVTGATTVDAGVTLTISSNSTIDFAQGAILNIAGTLDVQGLVASTTGTPTMMEPATGASTWAGIDVLSGGTATIRNVRLKGASVGLKTEQGAVTVKALRIIFDGGSRPLDVSADTKVCRGDFINDAGTLSLHGGTLTLADSRLSSGTTGDAAQMDGSAALSLVHVIDGVFGGGATGSYHCLIHDYASGGVTVDKSVFTDGAYLLDNSGATGTIHNSQIFGANIVNYQSGQANVNATDNWWGGATAPTIPGWTTTPNAATQTDAKVADAGPRPNGAGCEVDGSF